MLNFFVNNSRLSSDQSAFKLYRITRLPAQFYLFILKSITEYVYFCRK